MTYLKLRLATEPEFSQPQLANCGYAFKLSNHPMYFSRAVFKVLFPTAPITVSFFSPLLKIMTVGILLMPYLVAMPGLSSVLSLRHRTWPTYSEASSSIRGAIMRHGPHHGAQKSTRTGISLFKTSVSQVASFTTPATAQFQSNKSI
jgi:hypothetical protein